MNLDNGLWIGSLLVEAALVGLLLYRRAWRSFPVFLIFCIWEILSSSIAFLVLHYSEASYPTYYLIESILGYSLEFGVLVELAWSVLRPIRASLPRHIPFAIALIVLALGAAIWPFSGLQSFDSLPPAFRAIAHTEQTTSILRILFFLVLAGGQPVSLHRLARTGSFRSQRGSVSILCSAWEQRCSAPTRRPGISSGT